MDWKKIFRGVWVMTPAILLIWGLTIIGTQLQNMTKGGDNFSVQSFIWSEKEKSENNNLTNCPYELNLKWGHIIDYIPSDRWWVYNIVWWNYEVSCAPKAPQYDNILIRSNGGSDVITNPSNYYFSLQNSPYTWLCMAYTWCSREINVITWGTICGNGVLEINEQCDDGNNINWDGCDSMCNIETTQTGTRYDCIFMTWSIWTGIWWYQCIPTLDGKYTDPMCNNECSKLPYCGDGICQSNEIDKYGDPICKLDCKVIIDDKEPQTPTGDDK